MVMGIDPPGAKLALVALTPNVKLGLATARVMVWVCVMFPLVPVTARIEVPAAAPVATEIVRVLLLPAVTLGGENFAVTPAGSQPTENATAELNPLKLLILRQCCPVKTRSSLI